MRRSPTLVCLSTLVVGSAAFSGGSPSVTIASSSLRHRAARASSASASALSAASPHDDADADAEPRISDVVGSFAALAGRTLAGAAVSLAVLASPLPNIFDGGSSVARADEWGKETEAPTLFTGETTMICKKRGPLGACLQTAMRTADNDNDKALKYFKDPSAEVKQRQERMLKVAESDNEGNALIQKLRMQSEENREKNDQAVRVRTLQNDQGASFGPFSQQVVILNTDGRTFTLLQNPQAMRLKKAGYIEDRKFVVQPTQEAIDEALEGGESLGGAIKGFFGGKGGSGEGEVVKEVQVEVKEDAAVLDEGSADAGIDAKEGVAGDGSAAEATSDSS